MKEINHTSHLEFKTEEAAMAFLEQEKKKGLQGSIHRIMTAAPCTSDDEGAIEYKYNFAEYTRKWWMKREFANIWLVCLWSKNIEQDFLNIKPKFRTYQGREI